MHMARCALSRRAQRASPKAADIRLAAAIRPRHAIARSNASMQSGAAQGCFRDASLKEGLATDSLLLSVTKSVQQRCVATLFTSRKGHPAPRSRYSCSTCRAQRVLEKIGRRCGGQGASFRREDARCAPEAAALIGNLIVATAWRLGRQYAAYCCVRCLKETAAGYLHLEEWFELPKFPFAVFT